MHNLPASIRKIVEHLDRLPGIGPKHATRLAIFLLNDKERSADFVKDVDAALERTRFCTQCQTITDASLCDICKDPHRDQKTVCVVTHIQDVEPIERTGKHDGVYHILHGEVSPIEGITPDNIKIKELLERVKKDGIEEVIFALDATSEGEATVLYLIRKLKNFPIKLTKLARGIPMGSNIEYTDEVTLSSALEHREKL